MKKTWIIYAMLLVLVILAPIGFLSAYTINKELRYTILDTIYEGSGIIRDSARLYLKHTDRVYSEDAYPYTLLNFTLSNYGQRGVDSASVIEVATLLLERGVDIDAYNAKGSTALHDAVIMCQTDVVKFLLDNGADKSILTNYPESISRTNQMTALQLANWLSENSRTVLDWTPIIEILQ
jgi:hypothetical protein